MTIYFISLIIWLYFLTVFKRNKLESYFFIIGSIGNFIFLLKGLMSILIDPLAKLITYLVGLLGYFFPVIQSYPQYKLIFLDIGTPISLYIDFECSGILEILVFISLILFFSGYNVLNRFSLCIIGTLYIIFANVIRILSIIAITSINVRYYYVAHTLVGRLVFYTLTIIFYYVVFTKNQILNQKVGNFKYD